CSCAPQHPQMAFCQADVVIRGRFMGITPLSHNSSRGESVPWVRYEIKTTKIYKGFEPLTDVHFVDTPALESVCGYQHPAPLKGEEYLIMGKAPRYLDSSLGQPPPQGHPKTPSGPLNTSSLLG
uniref:Metalloproteinase inhibitor 1 n=1 Tax=Gopherus evgoodei TaxID=1825980 RepID=A0A8C4YRG3_9SAUR